MQPFDELVDRHFRAVVVGVRNGVVHSVALVVQHYLVGLSACAELAALQISPHFASGVKFLRFAIFNHRNWCFEFRTVVDHKRDDDEIIAYNIEHRVGIEHCRLHIATVDASKAREIYQHWLIVLLRISHSLIVVGEMGVLFGLI